LTGALSEKKCFIKDILEAEGDKQPRREKTVGVILPSMRALGIATA